MKKFLFCVIPLFLFASLSADPHAELEAIARGGGGARGGDFGGHAGGFDAGRAGLDRNANFENYHDYRRDEGLYNQGGYYGGYGGYYNGGYLAPDSATAPNDDMNQIYQNNLNNMERTGQ
ncbi:MAG TPA: hypothetical protein PLC42_02300 [Parachlamydiaceae bacterium]|nr:hypothetical protein [Parachlamydiaceae bacterium]